MPNLTFNPKSLEEILSRPHEARKKVEWRGRPGEMKPLWAILGDEPPYDWQPPAPEQTTTQDVTNEPELSVTGHPAFGIGPIHTALQYTPEGGQAEWISAGADLLTGRLVSGAGSAKDHRDVRFTDRPENNFYVGRITPPMGMSAAAYWDMLKSLDARYGDNVDYDLFPEIQDSYNSNSYTRGLLEASGGATAAPFDDLVGGASPLPARYFASSHLRDTGFPGSLTPQPGPLFRRLPRP